MEEDSLERAWDPAAAGAGALRVTAIAQLYFRMISHHPLTLLVVDALALAFGADGATVQNLVDYLGITEDRVRFGIDGIPAVMRCTNQQLDAEGTNLIDMATSNAEETACGDVARHDDQETRYFLNFKCLLPIVYAHVTRLLLSCCVTEVPSCGYVETIKAAQLRSFSRTDVSIGHAFFAGSSSGGAAAVRGADSIRSPPKSELAAEKGPLAPSAAAQLTMDSTGEHIDLSDAMKRRGAIEGVYCLGCSCYFLAEEFQTTLSRCPRCGKDTLRLCIQAIHRQQLARLAEQSTLVKVLPPVAVVLKRTVTMQTAGSSGGDVAAAKVQCSTSHPQHLPCVLASDPFLLQQALAFLSLFACRFASVNDAAMVVDAQEILTEPEYRERLRGGASLADVFRSRHRHAASVRVRVLSQASVDAARQVDSQRKLRKRAMLPPWLRHTHSLDALGGSAYYSGQREAHIDHQETVSLDGEERRAMESGATEKASTVHVTASQAVWREAEGSASTPAVKEARRGRGATSTAELLQRDMTKTATFIAAHYYNDEFDEVALPEKRTRRE